MDFCGHAATGIDPSQVRPVNIFGTVSVIVMTAVIVSVSKQTAVRMPLTTAQIASGRDRDPSAETHKRHTGDRKNK